MWNWACDYCDAKSRKSYKTKKEAEHRASIHVYNKIDYAENHRKSLRIFNGKDKALVLPIARSIRDIDIQYLAEIDYERTWCKGDCDGICRCTEITDTKITEDINLYVLTNNLAINKKKWQEIDYYGVERILRFYEAYDPNYWDIAVQGGYYGEEIGRVEFENREIQSDIDYDIRSFLKLKNMNKKVEFLIGLEYQHLLEEDKNKNWSIEIVNFDDIKVGNNEYKKKIKDSEYEVNLDYPICLCRNDLRLIDGYHRCASALKQNAQKVKVIRGS